MVYKQNRPDLSGRLQFILLYCRLSPRALENNNDQHNHNKQTLNEGCALQKVCD
jgi:hypothetical protein